MKACGIVAEYNPFHNGHLYQLKEAKRKTKADVMIVALSGNFLQRGEPAILDKWTRAEIALQNGADIVVEIPAAFSVQPADYFSKGAISLLKSLSCDTISFGAESGLGKDFMQAASLYMENEHLVDDYFQNHQKQGQTYAKNMEHFLSKQFPAFPIDITEPNNVLGFSYAKEIIRQGSQLSIETIPRSESHYHETTINYNRKIASATAIRKTIKADGIVDTLASVVPEQTLTALKQKTLPNWEDYFPYLKYKITSTPVEELESIYLMEKGLEYRVKEVMAKSKTMENFLTQLKTKQVTWARLQRLSFYILLNQTKESMARRLNKVDGIRLLGFTPKGQEYLNQVKHTLPMPLITNINKKTSKWVGFDITVGEIYRLVDENSIIRQDYTRKPINFIDNNR